MAPLKVRHAARYRDIALLLIKHARSNSVRNFADFGMEEGSGNADPDEQAVADAKKLAEELEAMGPSFVKLGQLLSTRADLLPPVYLDALGRLQDDVQSIEFEEIAAIVSDEIGARISKAFQSFDEAPLASASLGQVHRAVLRDGRQVAVKVQRPGVRAQVADDMEVMEELANFADAHTEPGRAFGFGGMVEQFRRSITNELDYQREAANLNLLADNLAEFGRIIVPRPIDDYSTSRVLTMDLVKGRNIGSLGPLARMEFDGSELVEQLFDAYLNQILLDGFVHADPHPGNVLLTDDGRLALIDVGMVMRVGPELRDCLLRLLIALSDGNGRDIASIMATLGERRDSWDPERFAREVGAMVQEHELMTVGQVKTGRVIGELARIAAECGLRPPPELTMLAKTLLNLDEVARILDPEFEPNAAIAEHVGELMRKRSFQEISPARLLASAMDAKEFAEQLPRQVNRVLESLAEGKFTISIQGLNEAELMRGTQKLANRLTSGLVIAALIVGASLLVRIDTKAKLFGYPTIAIISFFLAAGAGVWLIGNSLTHDLPQRRRQKRQRDDKA